MARQWPMKKGSYTLTSGFGPRWGSHHSGLDFGAPDGIPFYACAGGTVIHIGAAGGYGQWIVLDHPTSEGGGATEYGHMWNAFATGLEVGDWVDAGQLLGYVGSNGQSTGPHLHLTVWEYGYGGQRIDPEVWLQGAPHPGETSSHSSTKPESSQASTLFGIDVSEHQRNMSLKRAVEQDGMDFVILRLCDGTHVDKLFRSHLTDVERTDALLSTYWYLRAPSEGTTIAQQVDVIDLQMDGRRDLGVWIDVESVDKHGKYTLTGHDVWAAKRELESRGYHVPGIYTGRWYWESMPGGEPSMDGLGHLWASHYGDVDRAGSAKAIYDASGGVNHPGWVYPLGDRKPDLLQTGSRGLVAGHQPVDVNAFRGRRDQLAEIFHPSNSVASPPAPTFLETLMSQQIQSLINPKSSFPAPRALSLIDASTWRTEVLSEALLQALGIDTDEVLAAAIAADHAGEDRTQAIRLALNLKEQ